MATYNIFLIYIYLLWFSQIGILVHTPILQQTDELYASSLMTALETGVRVLMAANLSVSICILLFRRVRYRFKIADVQSIACRVERPQAQWWHTIYFIILTAELGTMFVYGKWLSLYKGVTIGICRRTSLYKVCVLHIAMGIHNLQVASVCTQSLRHNEALQKQRFNFVCRTYRCSQSTAINTSQFTLFSVS